MTKLTVKFSQEQLLKLKAATRNRYEHDRR